MNKKDVKYWYISHTRTELPSGFTRFNSSVTQKHPFEFLKELEKGEEIYYGVTMKFALISFQEITKEEFDLFEKD